ncbi:MAG: hypothetical protein IPI50_00060 [Saprospiraceae bacterium]|nr:hypothetical protein [Saprospiraceae bacterium]
MIYLHLLKHTQLGIQSPLDFISDDAKSEEIDNYCRLKYLLIHLYLYSIHIADQS